MSDKQNGLTLTQAIAVGVNTTSPSFSLAVILAPIALLVGYATPVALIVAFIPMAFTSLAFMYLNRRDPDCGTTFSWVSRAIGPRFGFISGWVIAAAGVLLVGSLAETALTYGFLTVGLDSLAENRTVIIVGAAVLLALVVGAAVLGSDSSIRVQTIITYVQVTILVVFGVVAAWVALQGDFYGFNADWFNPFHAGPSAFVSAMLLGIFGFWGWEAATNLSEECRKPSDAGKAGVLSTIILVGTYVLVAFGVVVYLGSSGFNPVGESGLVLVDMSGVVFGPLAFLILAAVAMSAFASTQSTMIPGSRAVLSMARKGALPARLGLIHPRFKTPWMSYLVLSTLAVVWFVPVSFLSTNAMEDTLTSLGILVAFYYSATAAACIVFYRKHVLSSVKGFILVGVFPALGALGLGATLVVAVISMSDPSTSASGQAWFGVSPPLVIAGTVIVLGLLSMLVRNFIAPNFFHIKPRYAETNEPPFTHVPTVEETAANTPKGGVLVDCNDTVDEVRGRARAANLEAAPGVPIYLVFGVGSPEIAGEEMVDAEVVLNEMASIVFKAAREEIGKNRVVYTFAPVAGAAGSVEIVAALMGPVLVV